EAFDSGFYSIESLARELATYAATVDLDPSRLDEVRRRRDLLFRLTKKYGATAAEVIAVGRDARRELELLDTAALDLRGLQAREKAAASELETHASALTAKRRDAAKRLSKAVDAVL